MYLLGELTLNCKIRLLFRMEDFMVLLLI